MTQKLFLKISLSLGSTEIKEVFDDLSSIRQDSFTLAVAESRVFSNVSKVFYIKTSGTIKLTLLKGAINSVIHCTDSCLLTDSYDSVTVLNEEATVNYIYCTIS